MYDRAQQESYIDKTHRITRQGDATLLRVLKHKTHKLELAPICEGSTNWNMLPARIRNLKAKVQFRTPYNAWLVLNNANAINHEQ